MSMNQKSLYESIMKNVAKEVKKALNENKYWDEPEEEYNIENDLDKAELAFKKWVKDNVNRTEVYLMLESSNEMAEEELTEWVDAVVAQMEDEGYEIIHDEFFVKHLVNYINSIFGENIVNTVKDNVKNGDPVNAGL